MDIKKHKNFDRITKVSLKHIPSTELIATKDFHFIPIYFFHTDALLELRNEECVSPYPAWPSPFSEKDLGNLIFEQQAIAGLNSSHQKMFGGFHKITGAYLGEYWLQKNPLDHLQMEFKFFRNPKEISTELLTTVLSQFLSYIFKKLNKKKIYHHLLANYQEERDILHHLGFKIEAHFKENIRINEKWVDELFLGLLASEWHK